MNEERDSAPEKEPRQNGQAATRSRAEPDQISLLGLTAVFLRQRRAILGFSLLLSVLVVALSWLQPQTWTATASFMPQAGTDGSRARLSTLAGQFGLNLGGAEAGQTPQFYADLLQSREVLGALASDTFVVMDTTGWYSREGETRGALADLLEVEAESPRVRRATVITWLREEVVSVSTDQETGVVRLSVQTGWPDLSEQIAAGIVELVNQFNLETRQSQAAAERRFIEERMESALTELRAAENRLQAFLQNNRQFQNSPDLLFQHDRLEREVAMRQQVYTSLVQSHEEARISEVRNTPVITVIEPAESLVRPDSRRLLLKGVLGFILGGIIGTFVGFGREYVSSRKQEEAPEYREVRALWEEVKMEVPPTIRRAIEAVRERIFR